MSDRVGAIRQKRGPVYVEWDIPDYFTHTGEDECLESPEFHFSDDTKWWLQLYPNGEPDTRGYIDFYLMKGTSDKKYDVTVKLGIMETSDSVFQAGDFNYSFPESREEVNYGFYGFILCSDLLKAKDKLTKDGVLRAICIIRFADNTVKETACETRSPKSLDILTQNFKDSYLSGRLCDVTVTVKDEDFQAHKFILAARSAVFAAMLEHDMVEKRSSTINITDCDPNSFKEFLLFLYTGKLEDVLPSKVFSLYKTADKYDVKELKEECVELMERNLSVDAFTDTVLVAMTYKESELLKSATEFFIENVKEIIPTVKWQLFLAENPCVGNELFMKYFKIKPVTEKK